MAAETTSKAAPTPLGTLRGHTAPVNAVSAISVTAVASGSGDGIVKLWDLRSRREKSSLVAHSQAGVLHITQLDAQRMLTHGRDGYIKLWDVNTLDSGSKSLSEWYCGSFTFTKVTAMRWRDGNMNTEFADVFVSPSAEEKDILVYDPRMDTNTPAMFVHLDDSEKKRGMCMSLSLFATSHNDTSAANKQQPYIAAGWEGGQLTLLDMRTGGKLACEAQVATGTNPLLAFDISVDGSSAICGSSAEEFSSVSIDYSSFTMQTKPFFKVNHGGINYIRIRADQRIFATAGWDHRVRIFHTRKLKPLAILKHHTESVFCVDFTPNSNFLISASKDHQLALWSIYPPTPDAAQQVLRPYR